MHSYTFHPQLLLRLPLMPYTSYTSGIDHYLLQPSVRNALLLASPTLYYRLRKASFDSSKLNSKQVKTLNNYFNRLHYRCTPFGSFAGTAAARWSEGATQLQVNEAAGRLHLLPDFELEREAFSMLETIAPDSLKEYYTNTTCCFYKREIRYLKSIDTGNNVKEYELRSITSSPVLRELLHFCSEPRTVPAILECICNLMQCESDEAESILRQLKEGQLLFSTLSPNVSGVPFGDRIQPYRDMYAQQMQDQLTAFENAPAPVQQPLPASFEPDEEGIARVKSYAHLELHLDPLKAGLHTGFQPHILDGLKALSQLARQPELPDLQAFKEAFAARFDQQCIPLLQALDPELGVGYADLGYNGGKDALLSDLKERPATGSNTETVSWSAAHRLLFEKWQALPDASEGIILEEQDLQGFPPAVAHKKTPTSTPVLFRLLGTDQLYLEQAGGATATSLAGRFSLFQDSAMQLCREAARQEIQHNPNVLFAEICSIQDNHAANIERRRSFYDYDIPVLTLSLLPSQQQVMPNDLWVRIRDGRVQLFSARHGKEVIPRLSSAFNFQRSALGLYRFLCDMQYQGLSMYAPFEMKDLFPGLSYYPRVTFRKTILQLATWYIGREALQPVLQAKDPAARLGAMKHWIARKRWPRYIALTEHDNQLVFDLEQDEAIASLLDNIKEQEQLVFKEFPFPCTPSAVCNQRGDGFQQQFFTALLHSEQVYEGLPREQCVPPTASAKSRKFMPGSEWLYTKIYCHTLRADDLLLNQVQSLIRSFRKKAGIEKWFFLRYTDTGFHIRFRILLPKEKQPVFMEALHKRLAPMVDSGYIGNIQLDTYEQEWERYDRNAIDKVESCFHQGSEWALLLLQQQRRMGKGSIFPAVTIIHNIFDAAGFSYEQRAELMQLSYASLKAEHGLTKEDELVLADKFRQLRSEIGLYLQEQDAPSGAAASLFQKSIGALLAHAQKHCPERTVSYLSDLIHVQLNRIFTGEPRKREMVVCFLMWKWYHSAAKRNG